MGSKRWLAGSLSVAALLLPLLTSGCGEEAPAPPLGGFAPLHYAYLTKLRLNVGSIEIEDHAAPLGPDDVSALSPVTPAQALVGMAHDRLFAAGLTGQARFVVDQASIVRGAGGTLYGQMAVHLDASSAGGARVGYAEARVARQHVPGSDPENLQTVLYGMTRDMMDAMNVELEFQIRRTMSDWLVAADAAPAAVMATPLGGAQGLPPAGPVPGGAPGSGTVPPPAPPPVSPPVSGDGAMPPAQPDTGDVPPPPPPVQMSPPPGYLQLPPGTPQ